MHVEDAVLDDLRERIRRTRWLDDDGKTGWTLGADVGYLKDLCSYWASDFDWRAHEAELNSFPQFLTIADGDPLHVIHARSPRSDALPLLLLHGWPGSVIEFLHLIPTLTEPERHGGNPADAFHVICPSLPGFTWSGQTRTGAWTVEREARALAAMMGELGYDRYVVQGGDQGAFVATQMALNDPAHVAAIHLNLVVVNPPKGDPDPMAGLTDQELKGLQSWEAFAKEGAGYYEIQATRPQTVSIGLNDSPAGLAAWIIDKFHAWTHHDGNLETAVSRDDLLVNVTSYWVTGTILSSGRGYYDNRRAGTDKPPADFVDVPTGIGVYPRELGGLPPRRWVEASYKLEYWKEWDKGGHFPSLEVPEQFVDDIRTFFRAYR